MNPMWLFLIVPFSAWMGALVLSLFVSNDNKAYINMDRFQSIMEIFAGHLRELGETKAAEAVETVMKAVSRGDFK